MGRFVEAIHYTRVCEQLETALADNAYLKSELGLAKTSDEVAAICTLGLTKAQAQLMLALYRSRRVLSRSILDEAVEETFTDSRGPNTIDMWVSKIRAKIGHESIETARGLGYRITDKGAEIVQGALARVGG